ncbi:CdaR family protein [Lapidilactobacillus bayanensis]|uniref:CdaR family protein n=1 Tax=Lapidilactobacillus bayanensis TaxID=2485998 RepID=UPI000F7A6785|nr:CdaR family protein [Lapidilactobacillus bayanensis]
MKDFFNRPWVYRVLSLGLAVLLFVYVTNQNLGSTRSSQSPEQTAVANTKETFSENLQVDADLDTYYVTGYPEKVAITIAGSKANVIAAKNTRNFRVYIDVRHLKVGTHTVRIKQTGLNQSLTYVIKPATVKVKIATRADKTFPIQVNYKSSKIADGYLTNTPDITPSTVRVSGAKSEVARVKQVVANLNLSDHTTTNFEQEVLLEALDKNGNTVDVLLTPQTAHVELPVYLPSKKMKLDFEPSSSSDSSKSYSLTSSVNSVTVYAPQSVLDKLGKTLEVDVNVKGISNNTQKTVKVVKPKGVIRTNPSSIAVNIQVIQSNSETSSSFSESSHTTSSSSSSSGDSSTDSSDSDGNSSNDSTTSSSSSSSSVGNSTSPSTSDDSE